MGILHNSAEVTIWQEMALNGYNPNGIFSSSTELWDDLKARADELMNDNSIYATELP